MSDEVKTRAEVSVEHQWNLNSLFLSDDEWKKELSLLSGKINGYADFKTRLCESVNVFRDALEFDLAISRTFEKIHTYAHLRNDEDRTNDHFKTMYEQSLSLNTRIAELSSYLVPEIQALPEEMAKEYREHPLLADYKFYIERILRFRPHTRSEEIENLLAMAGEVHHASSEIFTQLDNADMRFGSIRDEKGKDVELTHGNFSSFLQNKNRDVRRNAFFTYYDSYDAHRHTIAASLSSSIKKDRFYSRVRRFSSALEASLFGDNVDRRVYENLIRAVSEHNKPLVKYLDFRKKKLGLDTLHFFDTYVPLVGDIEFNMPYEEAVETCIEALKPLGDDYVRELKEGLLGGWVDRYENRGKRSGAYSSGCYDSRPYILLNYRDDNINSLYTLIHEAGHSMHSLYSHRTQPYHYGDYAIFVAEVASTFNETLLSAYLLEKNKKNKTMRAYLLNREIDNIRATLYRQTMFAEFEKITHEMAENDHPLTLESLRTVYRTLLQTYFGGALEIDTILELEGFRIPHFYHAFYVYKYATGISAAIALAERVLAGVPGSTDDYRRFLGLGGSMFPLDQLKIAGVDMSERRPIDEALGHFEKLVDNFVDILS